MQIKITIDDDTYKKLKKSAKDNLRSLSNEAFFRLRGSFISPTPTPIIPTPIISPTIPVEPYRITLTNSTNTEPVNQTGGGTAAVPTTTTEQPNNLPAGITEAAVQEKIKELKRRIMGGDDEYYRQQAIKDLTKNNKKPIGTVYESDYKPTLNIDDFDDEPELEWDADRGGARPRVL